MKANELRIGNYVEYSGELVNIVGITEEHPFINMITIDYLEYEEIRPIPLTEEWLIKFGFEHHKHQEDMYFISGMQVWNCNDLFMCNKNGIILNSVHRLQNLYFALTKEELTYENI